MADITIFKTKTALPELYGRVSINNNKIKADGVTCVFQKYLESGITGKDHKKVVPQDGDIFLSSLKTYLTNEGLSISDCT
ncbi:MAG: hypothetical protein JW787_13415 [Sedimentisphaerales bacterium]|nr:hypothetical protein [Sedimentisphaerales bacterium]